MKSGQYYLIVLMGLFFLLISACEREKTEPGDYSGVSELISDRHKARSGVVEKTISNDKSSSKTASDQSAAKDQKQDSKKENILSTVLYEQEIEIIGAASRQKLATGIAYINKEGQIIRIKIVRK